MLVRTSLSEYTPVFQNRPRQYKRHAAGLRGRRGNSCRVKASSSITGEDVYVKYVCKWNVFLN